MMRSLASCLFAATVLAGPALAQAKAKAQNVPEIPYESVPNYLKRPPGLYMGEAMGVATNSKGHLFVYTRSANTRLFEFDPNGKYVRELGAGNYGFEFAHSVRVDPEDNIWVVDEGTNMVIKFNPAGKVLMVLGHRPDAVAGAVATNPAPPKPPAAKYLFGRPTDVGWDPQGNISYPTVTSRRPPGSGSAKRRLSAPHRRGMGFRRQHLRRRQARQCSRREI